MDLLLTLDVTLKRTLLILPPPHTQTFHQRFPQMQLQHSNHLQWTGWTHYCKYRGLTCSVIIFPNVYSTVNHHNMKQIFYSHKRITIQAHHGLWKTVSCPHYPEILEVHSLSRSSQQTRSSRKLMHILFNKKTILLEGNE